MNDYGDDWIGASEVAKRLHVSEARVRALIERGALPGRKLANRWLVPAHALHNSSITARVEGRPFSSENAWGLLFLASGKPAEWLSAVERSRLKARLKAPRFPFASRFRRRANVAYLRGDERALRKIVEDDQFVRSGVSAAEHHNVDVVAPGVVEGYLPKERLAKLSGLKVKHGEYVGHSMDGQIGTGGPRIKLGNVNGGIRVSRAQDGLPLSPAASLQGEAAEEAEQAEDLDVAVTVAEKVRVQIDTERIARQAQREAQRQVDTAMRESQREIERAQREMVREQARTRVAVMTKRQANDDYGRKVTAKETRTYAVSGTPRITLNTFDGRVTVRGWDKQEVTYNATKAARDEEALKNITIQSQQQGEAVSITATSDDQQSGSVDFEIYVPRQSTLHVSSGDGALNLEGVKGQITLRSGDGPIEVSNGGGQLQVNTGDGVIRVIKFEGQVDARTGDGGIALDGNFDAVTARTGDGTISLSVPAGSSFTIETNAPDEINNEGFTVAEDITPSPRVKRWRIGNGGKVFVLKTGDGKILLRPRQ